MKLELRNPRFPDRELRENLSELILYSRYAGINIETFRNAIAKSSLIAGNEGLEMRYGGRLVLETDFKTANLISQLVQMYPVFSTWEIKMSKAKKASSVEKAKIKMKKKKEKTMAAKKKAKKKPAKKKAAKKKAKKKAAKKKPAKKKAAKSKPAKKKPAKKKAKKKK